MPRIFDNIDLHLLPALTQTLSVSQRADFCVGYFNLRGWKQLDRYVQQWPGGEDHCCRLMVGMQRTPQEELRQAFALGATDEGIDQPQAVRLKRKLAEEFRRQLMLGAPTNEDEVKEVLERARASLRAGAEAAEAAERVKRQEAEKRISLLELTLETEHFRQINRIQKIAATVGIWSARIILLLTYVLVAVGVYATFPTPFPALPGELWKFTVPILLLVIGIFSIMNLVHGIAIISYVRRLASWMSRKVEHLLRRMLMP